MFDGILSLVKRNGDGQTVAGSFDDEPGGGGTNGHGLAKNGAKRPGSYCLGADDTATAVKAPVAPDTEIAVPDSYPWSLEVRNDQQLLATMHSHNPFVLISFFRDYTVFYGDPQPPYTVWLRHRESNRGAPMKTQFGEGVWRGFLRELDPEIDEYLENTPAGTQRSSMFNTDGQPTNPDSVFEQAFGVA